MAFLSLLCLTGVGCIVWLVWFAATRIESLVRAVRLEAVKVRDEELRLREVNAERAEDLRKNIRGCKAAIKRWADIRGTEGDRLLRESLESFMDQDRYGLRVETNVNFVGDLYWTYTLDGMDLFDAR